VRIVLAAVSIKSLISEPFDCATRSGPLPLNLAGDYGPLTLTRDNRKVRRSSRAGIELIESCCTRRATSRRVCERLPLNRRCFAVTARVIAFWIMRWLFRMCNEISLLFTDDKKYSVARCRVMILSPSATISVRSSTKASLVRVYLDYNVRFYESITTDSDGINQRIDIVRNKYTISRSYGRSCWYARRQLVGRSVIPILHHIVNARARRKNIRRRLYTYVNTDVGIFRVFSTKGIASGRGYARRII